MSARMIFDRIAELSMRSRMIHQQVSGLSYTGNESLFDTMHALEDEIDSLRKRVEG